MTFRHFFFASVLVCMTVDIHAQDRAAIFECVDGVCGTEFSGSNVYSVICPHGYSAVTQIEQAPRLSSLSGKTIAIAGGSFMASVTHPELKKQILDEYPDARGYSPNLSGLYGAVCGNVCSVPFSRTIFVILHDGIL